MRIRHLQFGLAASLAAMLSTAAAGEELKAGPSVAPSHWTGFYVGVDTGYGVGDREISWSGNPASEAAYLSSGGLARSTPLNPTGFLGGAHAGYDHQFGRYLIGIETDLALAKISGNGPSATGRTITIVDTSTLPLFTSNNSAQYQSSAEQTLHALGTLRGRLGILATEQLLIYGTGGFAYGRATVSASVASGSVNSDYFTSPDNTLFFTQQYPACHDVCASGSQSRWLAGGTVGAGLEYAFLDRWTARFEYTYYNLGRLSVTLTDPRFPAQAFSAGALFAGQVARLGLSYRFE